MATPTEDVSSYATLKDKSTAATFRPCSLRTGCFCVVSYTFVVALLILGFTGYDYYNASEYSLWLRIAALSTVVMLFLAGSCLITGILRDSPHMIHAWLVKFYLYLCFKVTSVAWNGYQYQHHYDSVPDSIRKSVHFDIILSSLLFVSDVRKPVIWEAGERYGQDPQVAHPISKIVCLVVVHRYGVTRLFH